MKSMKNLKGEALSGKRGTVEEGTEKAPSGKEKARTFLPRRTRSGGRG